MNDRWKNILAKLLSIIIQYLNNEQHIIILICLNYDNKNTILLLATDSDNEKLNVFRGGGREGGREGGKEGGREGGKEKAGWQTENNKRQPIL